MELVNVKYLEVEPNKEEVTEHSKKLKNLYSFDVRLAEQVAYMREQELHKGYRPLGCKAAWFGERPTIWKNNSKISLQSELLGACFCCYSVCMVCPYFLLW
jgi:hypothetical protein